MIIHISTLAVTYVDDLIGQILDALVQSDLADNTIVTLIGDHGWTLGENRVRFHAFFSILNHVTQSAFHEQKELKKS